MLQNFDRQSYELRKYITSHGGADGLFPPDVSEEDAHIAIKMLAEFKKSLRSAVIDADECSRIFWIDCTAEEIVWGRRDPDSPIDYSPPPPIAWIDFDELGCDGLFAVTPEELYILMFEPPHWLDISKHLVAAILWQRDRVKNGDCEGVRSAAISRSLIKAVDAIEHSCRIARFDILSDA